MTCQHLFGQRRPRARHPDDEHRSGRGVGLIARHHLLGEHRGDVGEALKGRRFVIGGSRPHQGGARQKLVQAVIRAPEILVGLAERVVQVLAVLT